jgi:hypothetical protein
MIDLKELNFTSKDEAQFHPTAVQFHNHKELRIHVIKHALSHHERWKHIFPAHLVEKARKEIKSSPDKWGIACDELGKLYQEMVSKHLLITSHNPDTHDHHTREEENGQYSLGLNSWPDPDSILYVAASIRLRESSRIQGYEPVRHMGHFTYVLKTAYRPPELVNSDKQEFRMRFWRERRKKKHPNNKYFSCRELKEHTNE